MILWSREWEFTELWALESMGRENCYDHSWTNDAFSLYGTSTSIAAFGPHTTPMTASPCAGDDKEAQLKGRETCSASRMASHDMTRVSVSGLGQLLLDCLQAVLKRQHGDGRTLLDYLLNHLPEFLFHFIFLHLNSLIFKIRPVSTNYRCYLNGKSSWCFYRCCGNTFFFLRSVSLFHSLGTLR